jgi:hypothetical protein
VILLPIKSPCKKLGNDAGLKYNDSKMLAEHLKVTHYPSQKVFAMPTLTAITTQKSHVF